MWFRVWGGSWDDVYTEVDKVEIWSSLSFDLFWLHYICTGSAIYDHLPLIPEAMFATF